MNEASMSEAQAPDDPQPYVPPSVANRIASDAYETGVRDGRAGIPAPGALVRAAQDAAATVMSVAKMRDDPYAKALRIWGTAHVKGPEDVVWIAPIGSRSDALLFWKSGGRVATGSAGPDAACYEGSLDEFAERVKEVYGRPTEYERDRRIYGDYSAAIAFLTMLKAPQ